MTRYLTLSLQDEDGRPVVSFGAKLLVKVPTETAERWRIREVNSSDPYPYWGGNTFNEALLRFIESTLSDAEYT